MLPTLEREGGGGREGRRVGEEGEDGLPFSIWGWRKEEGGGGKEEKPPAKV